MRRLPKDLGKLLIECPCLFSHLAQHVISKDAEQTNRCHAFVKAFASRLKNNTHL